MRMTTLLAGILGVVLGVVGFEYGDAWPHRLGDWVGWAGTAITIAVLLRQFLEGAPFERQFDVTDWASVGNEFELRVPHRDHGKGKNAGVTVYQFGQTGFQETVVDNHQEYDGTLVLKATRRFSGKVVLR